MDQLALTTVNVLMVQSKSIRWTIKIFQILPEIIAAMRKIQNILCQDFSQNFQQRSQLNFFQSVLQ